jgi:ABC-2 type transport system permease protein
VIAIIGCVLPSFFQGSDKASTYDIGVAVERPDLAAALAAVGDAQHVQIVEHHAPAAESQQKVRNGTWDAAVLPGNRLVAKHPGDTVVGIVQSAYELAATTARLRAAGLSGEQAATALAVTPLHVEATTSAQTTQKQTIAIIAVVVLFSQLVTFCTWVATGIVEEKSSRVVELVLSSVRALQLLTGKLVGIGLLAAAQVLAFGVAALVAATASGSLTVPASAVVTLAVAFVGFLLGYAFFAALAAALGSTVSRQEEVSGILAPVTIGLTVCYAASFATASSPDSAFARAVSIVPPFSAIGMPARIARGSVHVLDIVLAVALLVVATVAIVLVAARIYRASVLHTGTRVPLRQAWRGEAVSDIS